MLGRTNTKSEQARREKRDTILQTAINLFADSGYASTTISEVAKASGVSFGSVFTYFPSKDELFRSAVLEPLEEMKEVFLQFEILRSPSVTVQTMIQRHMQFISKQGRFLRIVQHVIAQKALFPELFAELDNFHQKLKDTLRPIVLEGQRLAEFDEVEPELVVTAYLSLLVGLRLAHPDEPGAPMWTEFCSMAYRLFGPRQGVQT